MEFLAILLTLFTLFLLILAIVGLFKPSVVKQTSRIKAFASFAGAAFVCFILVGVIASNEKDNDAQEAKVEQPAPASTEPDVVQTSAPAVEEKPPVPDESKNPRLNFNAVVETLRGEFKTKVEYSFGDNFCPQPNYCEAIANGIQITAMGHIVDARTSIKASPKTYQTVCAGILTALSGANSEVAWSINKQAFDYAAQNGRAETELGNVMIKIRPDSSSNLLQCQYVRVIR